MAVEQPGSMDRSLRASPSRWPKSDHDAASESSSVHSVDTADRRDADILTQVMSAKSEEYRMLFRLPPDEVLVQDFNCALQENILLQGHMYLFIHHVCFYSNIFGFETKKTISFHEVTCVRKAKTAAIFHNAIEIVAGEKKHFFGSFLSRDEAYRLVVDGWAQHSSEGKAFQDSQDVKSEANTQENAPVMLEGIGDSKRSTNDSLCLDRNGDADMPEELKPFFDGKDDINVSEKLPEAQENGESSTNLSSEELTWQIEEVDAPNIPEYFTMVAEGKFPVNVENFFNHFISDRAFEFMKNFHILCGDKDFQCTPWRSSDKFGHVRDLSFLHPVKILIGAKFGHCQEIQKFRVYRNSHLVIETFQQISEVPFADYFHVEVLWDVIQDGTEVNGCILRVYTNVAFSKKTMFKGKIEQSTKEECREAYGIWIKNAHKLLKQMPVNSEDSVNMCRRVGGQDTGICLDNHVGLESSLENNEPLQQLVSQKFSENVNISKIINPRIDNQKESASMFATSWTTFISYLKSQRHFPLILVLAFATIIILMQMSIIILLTRAPQVHVVSQGHYTSNIRGYSSENIEWLNKRLTYLREDMLIMETRIEMMRQEYTTLKPLLHSLERITPDS